MTEDDWNILFKWNNDPEVLYYSEGAKVTSFTLEEIKKIYRTISQDAYCFIIEVDGKPVGDCWLQKMNLERILKSYPDLDCRRIDLIIGEKEYWRQGIGREVIRILTEFAFENEGAHIVFGCDIADYNTGSLKAFQKVGYKIVSKIKEEPGSKAKYTYDVAIKREQFSQMRKKISTNTP